MGLAEDFFGRLAGGCNHGLALAPAVLTSPHPPQPRPPPPGRPGESLLDSPFFYAPHASQHFGAREVWADERGIHHDKPLRVGGWGGGGGLAGDWWWQPEMTGRQKGQVPPPLPPQGGKDV